MVEIQFVGYERGVNVEKVKDFCPDQLVQFIGEHFALATEPIVFDREWYSYHWEYTEMFLAVDFHFQVDLAGP